MAWPSHRRTCYVACLLTSAVHWAEADRRNGVVVVVIIDVRIAPYMNASFYSCRLLRSLSPRFFRWKKRKKKREDTLASRQRGSKKATSRKNAPDNDIHSRMIHTEDVINNMWICLEIDWVEHSCMNSIVYFVYHQLTTLQTISIEYDHSNETSTSTVIVAYMFLAGECLVYLKKRWNRQ